MINVIIKFDCMIHTERLNEFEPKIELLLCGGKFVVTPHSNGRCNKVIEDLTRSLRVSWQRVCRRR